MPIIDALFFWNYRKRKVHLARKNPPEEKRIFGLDRLDVSMTIAIAVLLAMLGVVLMRGDQIGLGIQSYFPRGSISSKAAIQVTFDEPLDNQLTSQMPSSVIAIDPAIPGKLTTSSSTITFQPDQAWQRGQTYTITLKAGLVASHGRHLKQDFQWQFTVREPRIAYLGPADATVQNLFIVDTANPADVKQLTHDDPNGSNGVLGYDVSPDGNQIVYTRRESDGTSGLYMWQETVHNASLLYACKDAVCTDPAFRPDGKAIAFVQTHVKTATVQSRPSPRVWVLDLTQNNDAPLFTDRQELGYSPRWSPDGSKLAVYDSAAGGIMIHDFKTGTDRLIQDFEEEFGTFSPNGKWLFFPNIVSFGVHKAGKHLILVDLTSATFAEHNLVLDSDPVDDTSAEWSPDGKSILLAQGMPFAVPVAIEQGESLVQIDIETGATTTLVAQADFTNSKFEFSPSGEIVVMERFSLTGSEPEIWTYNFATKALTQIAVSVTSPRWIP